jgi:hypothetical protein
MQLCSYNNWDPTQRTQLHHIISYFKSFCSVGLIMVFFGLKQVVIKFTLEQSTKAQRGAVEVQPCSFFNLGARCGGW